DAAGTAGLAAQRQRAGGGLKLNVATPFRVAHRDRVHVDNVRARAEEEVAGAAGIIVCAQTGKAGSLCAVSNDDACRRNRIAGVRQTKCRLRARAEADVDISSSGGTGAVGEIGQACHVERGVHRGETVITTPDADNEVRVWRRDVERTGARKVSD